MRSDVDFLNEFKASYKEEFGEAINDKEASDKFYGLVSLLRTIIHGTSVQGLDDEPKKCDLIDESDSSANLLI